MEAIRSAGVRIGIDPLGRRGVHYWQPIIERYGIAATVVNDAVDPTFRFMTVDWDGKIRMDCSSPYAMARLVGDARPLRRRLRQRHRRRPPRHRHPLERADESRITIWPSRSPICSRIARDGAATARSARPSSAAASSIASRRNSGRRLVEVPVGFKWFVDGLLDGSFGFGGEESAGASFLRRDGSVWTTDKDGIILGLLAAEMTARTGRDPEPAVRRADRANSACPSTSGSMRRRRRRRRTC